MDTATRRQLLSGIGATAVVGVAGCTSQGAETAESGPYDGVLGRANNVDAESVTDRTDAESVTVSVGVGQQGFAFGPAAVQVSPGTTVTWEWTGEGGGHNIVEDAENPAFTSKLRAEAGHTFEHTFSDPGVYTYYCSPHRGYGMIGVVEVIAE
ncbi:MAG: halocyanin domain protein [Halonotius sp. J07HN4]|nr:MAG: halocyanin domain protein [Halonotius sp. J07HN4]